MAEQQRQLGELQRQLHAERVQAQALREQLGMTQQELQGAIGKRAQLEKKLDRTRERFSRSRRKYEYEQQHRQAGVGSDAVGGEAWGNLTGGSTTSQAVAAAMAMAAGVGGRPRTPGAVERDAARLGTGVGTGAAAAAGGAAGASRPFDLSRDRYLSALQSNSLL